MSPTPKYFIVEATALPDIFLKVAEAKRILELREADTVNEATLKVGISRSAFYKYKDAIRPFNDMLNGHIVTFQVLLKDEPGVLSLITGGFAAEGVSIASMVQKGERDEAGFVRLIFLTHRAGEHAVRRALAKMDPAQASAESVIRVEE